MVWFFPRKYAAGFFVVRLSNRGPVRSTQPTNQRITTGDVVFANSTCFGDDLMKKLAQGATALKEGAIVVTMTDPIPSPAFEILQEV